jgi:hypothetical protein
VHPFSSKRKVFFTTDFLNERINNYAGQAFLIFFRKFPELQTMIIFFTFLQLEHDE